MRKISRRSFLKAATVACALTALTACGGGDESAAVSVAKDENGAYVDTLTITSTDWLGKPGAARRYASDQFVLVSAAPEEVTRRAAQNGPAVSRTHASRGSARTKLLE